jgi:hypothetical protein
VRTARCHFGSSTGRYRSEQCVVASLSKAETKTRIQSSLVLIAVVCLIFDLRLLDCCSLCFACLISSTRSLCFCKLLLCVAEFKRHVFSDLALQSQVAIISIIGKVVSR